MGFIALFAFYAYEMFRFYYLEDHNTSSKDQVKDDEYQKAIDGSPLKLERAISLDSGSTYSHSSRRESYNSSEFQSPQGLRL